MLTKHLFSKNDLDLLGPWLRQNDLWVPESSKIKSLFRFESIGIEDVWVRREQVHLSVVETSL